MLYVPSCRRILFQLTFAHAHPVRTFPHGKHEDGLTVACRRVRRMQVLTLETVPGVLATAEDCQGRRDAFRRALLAGRYERIARDVPGDETGTYLPCLSVDFVR